MLKISLQCCGLLLAASIYVAVQAARKLWNALQIL